VPVLPANWPYLKRKGGIVGDVNCPFQLRAEQSELYYFLMPEYYESHTLLHSNILDRLVDPSTEPSVVKTHLFDTAIKNVPLHTEVIRPGIKFAGIQSSTNMTYNVEVSLQDVDIRESFLCGYLNIQGLTEEYPSLTTFFEAEIIGKNHRFHTRKWVLDVMV